MNTFSLWFVYCFVGGCKASNECNNPSVVKFFEYSFFFFVMALISWLCDNFLCHTLQELPYNIPYLHLHAMGWHVGTAIGLHFLFSVLIAHYGITTKQFNVKQSYLLYFIPYLQIIPYNNQTLNRKQNKSKSKNKIKE